jgi:hypothetical protein
MFLRYKKGVAKSTQQVLNFKSIFRQTAAAEATSQMMRRTSRVTFIDVSVSFGWPLSATLGVRRSLSSVDNIGCLDHRISDYRFGGIRLEIGEQATSLAPTILNQPSQKATIFSKHFIFICI